MSKHLYNEEGKFEDVDVCDEFADKIKIAVLPLVSEMRAQGYPFVEIIHFIENTLEYSYMFNALNEKDEDSKQE